MLTIEDFKLFRSSCEIRYTNSYLVYDRTGQILHDIRDTFPSLNVISAAPNQTVFAADEGTFGLEVAKAHFIAERPDPKLENFAHHCQVFFHAVTDRLDVKVFGRIGLRTIWRKEFKTQAESQDALDSIDLLNLKSAPRFGVSGGATEISLRWQDAEIGAVMRLHSEVSEVDIKLPVELRVDGPNLHKKIVGLLMDIDYYTVAPVERGQWAPTEWLPQKIRLIRKESDKILQGDSK